MWQAAQHDVLSSVIGLAIGAGLAVTGMYLYWTIRAARGCDKSYNRITADPMWKLIHRTVLFVLSLAKLLAALVRRGVEAGRS